MKGKSLPSEWRFDFADGGDIDHAAQSDDAEFVQACLRPLILARPRISERVALFDALMEQSRRDDVSEVFAQHCAEACLTHARMVAGIDPTWHQRLRDAAQQMIAVDAPPSALIAGAVSTYLDGSPESIAHGDVMLDAALTLVKRQRHREWVRAARVAVEQRAEALQRNPTMAEPQVP